jgi:hypothetical protein
MELASFLIARFHISYKYWKQLLFYRNNYEGIRNCSHLREGQVKKRCLDLWPFSETSISHFLWASPPSCCSCRFARTWRGFCDVICAEWVLLCFVFRYRKAVATDRFSSWPSIYSLQISLGPSRFSILPHRYASFQSFSLLFTGMMVGQETGYTWLSLWCTVEGPGGKYSCPETGETFEHRHAHSSSENFPWPE